MKLLGQGQDSRKRHEQNKSGWHRRCSNGLEGSIGAPRMNLRGANTNALSGVFERCVGFDGRQARYVRIVRNSFLFLFVVIMMYVSPRAQERKHTTTCSS